MSADLEARLGALVGAAAVDRVAALGREALPRAAPATVEELVEVLHLAASDGLAVVPAGLGSKLGWTAAPERVDLVLSTRRLTGILEHEPADGTLAARAGTTLAELSAAARAGGHFLTPDVPGPEGATLGGTVAAGASGPDRLRFGPVRHHVLGTGVVLGDGTRAKSGGRLVKNVTGFDLHRLYTGSHGSLCVIVDVALRLFPAPEREVLVLAGAEDSAAALDMSRAALELAARPISLTVARTENHAGTPTGAPPWALFARLFGKAEAVEAELALLRGAWPAAAVLEGDEARAEAEALRDTGFEAQREPWLRCPCLPSQVAPALAALERRLDEAGLAARVLAQPGVATLDAQLAGEVDPVRAAACVRAWRGDLDGLGARAELRNAPAALAEAAPVWHAAPRGLEMMRRLKHNLDPAGIFAAGRLAGGI